eukprot:2657637-Amphidinium_carterae.1
MACNRQVHVHHVYHSILFPTDATNNTWNGLSEQLSSKIHASIHFCVADSHDTSNMMRKPRCDRYEVQGL